MTASPASSGSRGPHAQSHPDLVSTPTAAREQVPDTPDPTDGEKRPKRGVRHLSEQQLEKKRKNDREAQRAIRERTKSQIETLEGRIRMLESGQAYQQLQHVERERDALRAENEQIKQSLAAVQATIQSIIERRQYALYSRHAVKIEPPTPTTVETSSTQATLTSAHSLSGIVNACQVASATSSPSAATECFHGNQTISQPESSSDLRHVQNRTELPCSTHPRQYLCNRQYHPIPQHPERSNPHAALVRQARGPVQYPISPPLSNSPSTHTTTPSTNCFGRTPGPHKRSIGSIPHILNPTNTLYTNAPFLQTRAQLMQTPSHLCLPRLAAPTCHLVTIMHDFLGECKQLLSAGRPVDHLLGPLAYDTTFMIHPTRPNDLDRRTTLPELLLDTLKGFTQVHKLPDKMGLVHNNFLFYRWMIHPSPPTWAVLPHTMRPTPSQLTIPHPFWVAQLPYPSLREALCTRRPQLSLEDFFLPFSTGVSVNWPHTDDPLGCMYRVPGKEGRDELRILPAFREHVEEVRNWTTGLEFERAWPELARCVWVKKRAY